LSGDKRSKEVRGVSPTGGGGDSEATGTVEDADGAECGCGEGFGELPAEGIVDGERKKNHIGWGKNKGLGGKKSDLYDLEGQKLSMGEKKKEGGHRKELESKFSREALRWPMTRQRKGERTKIARKRSEKKFSKGVNS